MAMDESKELSILVEEQLKECISWLGDDRGGVGDHLDQGLWVNFTAIRLVISTIS